MTSIGIKHGPLSAEELAQIEHLASTMRKPTSTKIAWKLNRSASTIGWHLLTNGLVARNISYPRVHPYRRGDRMIYPFSRGQDRRIVELRSDGKSPTEIAAIVSREFNVPRKAHSIDVRLRMLAGYEDGPEAHIA